MSLILGPSASAVEALRKMRLEGEVSRVTVLVAWARLAGIAYFFDALGPDISKVRIMVGMAGAGTSAEALSHLRAHCGEVWLFHKHHRQTFHPKVYGFDEPGSPPNRSRLLVGSSNLTGGGLFSNFEGSLMATLEPAKSAPDLEVWNSLNEAFASLSASPYAERIADDDRIQMLLDERYLSTETTLRRRSGSDGEKAAKGGTKRGKPESPPPPMQPPRLPPAARVFTDPIPVIVPVEAPAIVKAPAPGTTDVAEALAAQAAPFVADGVFFIRTLTANDVAKALGNQTGTFEPDLGVTARNEMPGFWGWPERFNVVVHKSTPRQEWDASAIGYSSARPEGVEMRLMIWFRSARPAVDENSKSHAAEFRLRPGIGEFRLLLPTKFSVKTLVLLERLPRAEAHDFRFRIIAEGEDGYADFQHYLRRRRTGHSYGYGPDDPEE